MSSDRSTDNLDIASDIQEAFNQRGIEASRKAALQQTDENFDGKNCIECGGEIPSARLALGRIKCVSCQDALEKRSRFYR